MSDEGKVYAFLWLIENFRNYPRHKEGLKSPEFIADGLEGTAWYLCFLPSEYDVIDDEDCIAVCLKRSEVDEGPNKFPLKLEISVLAENGSILYSHEYQVTFELGKNGRTPLYLLREDYLSGDTLRVLCKIWKAEGKLQQVKQIVARTRVGIEQVSFLHVTESFSSLEPNQKKTIQVKSPSKNGLDLSCSVYYTDDPWDDKVLIVEFTPSDTNKILTKCKISLVDKSGKMVKCDGVDNEFYPKKDIIYLSLSRKDILDRERIYLPDDKLSLQCECIFSSGVELEKIERTVHELPMLALKQLNGNDQNKHIYDAAEKLNACPSALDDFKALYNDQLLTDMELKTKTKSFPAHKNVLCARSSVFKAMLTNDMKEKNTNCIKVYDLEDDTVQQLLLFLYSDNLENLQWESAINLYYAGDKYAIKKLKVMCASFLVDNLSISTASELLLLADTHSDSDFKEAVEDFIFQHEEQVFLSEEWENLIETHSRLASKTMRLKYKRARDFGFSRALASFPTESSIVSSTSDKSNV